MQEEITVALAGNPNSGKTTIFNNLTGSRQHVGNWPGVTVEKKEGSYKDGDVTVKVVDLPGTYSLGAYSLDEVVARDFILTGGADVVVNVVDASNIERNLYLTTQLLEMGANVIIVLNMYDEAENKYIIDTEKITELLGTPVVKTVGHENKGTQEVVDQILKTARNPIVNNMKLQYGPEVEPHLKDIEEWVGDFDIPREGAANRHWIAIKLLEEDENIQKLVTANDGGQAIVEETAGLIEHIREVMNDDPEVVIADHRYGFIAGLMREAIRPRGPSEMRRNISDKIDKVLTNRIVGLPIFLLVAWGMFQLTFTVAGPLVGWIEVLFEWLGTSAAGWLGTVNAHPLIASFVVDGAIGGVGSVLVFIPNIFMLFLLISIIEDTGYMARVAFLMDKIMHKMGLHGRS
ncbi:MAG: ferrous iron transport protein B, partial [bacterium]|nr:ferrous iron transport protein B [bacterium]